MLGVKNMHFGSPSDPSQTAAAKAKPRYVYSILKPHGQSSKSPVRQLTHEAKPSCIHTILKKHHLPRVGPKQLCAPAHLGCTCVAGTSYLYLKSTGCTVTLAWGEDGRWWEGEFSHVKIKKSMMLSWPLF